MALSYNDLPRFFGPSVMRVFPHIFPFLPLVQPGGSVPYSGIVGHRSLGFDSPDCCGVDSDYNPFAIGLAVIFLDVFPESNVKSYKCESDLIRQAIDLHKRAIQ